MKFFEIAAQVIPLLFIVLAFNIGAFDTPKQGREEVGYRPHDISRAWATTFSVALLAAAEWVSIDVIRSGSNGRISENFVFSALALGGSMVVVSIVYPHVELLVRRLREGSYRMRTCFGFLLFLGLSPLLLAWLIRISA